jgi:hypothetical protein
VPHEPGARFDDVLLSLRAAITAPECPHQLSGSAFTERDDSCPVVPSCILTPIFFVWNHRVSAAAADDV